MYKELLRLRKKPVLLEGVRGYRTRTTHNGGKREERESSGGREGSQRSVDLTVDSRNQSPRV